ncbi:MAG TPA: hypothetical protein VI603_05165 [Saprospiraceae bacterium]|nr:hypothetical protein [Saprospiraceae bacterium]
MLQKSITGLILLLFVTINTTHGQEALNQRLTGKTTLSEIMKVVDQYYRENPEAHEEGEYESAYLQWKRWEWYMSGRLGHGGDLVNIPAYLMRGLEEKERMTAQHLERNVNSAWTFMGPSSSPLLNDAALYNGIGRVDRIVFHPANASIIFLCTPAGGLWNTLNGGTLWNNLTDQLPAVGISGFVISYANTSDMYLLTGDGDSGLGNVFGYTRTSIGVLKSTDGGISWHQSGAFPEIDGPYAGYKLIQSPANPDLLLAATSNGLYRTIDGGDTWVRELDSLTYDIEFKPGNATRVYASTKGDIWISTNSGDTWTSNSTYDVNPNTCGSNGGGRIQIAVAPSDGNRLYFVAGPVTAVGQFCGLWLSTDSGSTFTRQSNTPNILGRVDNGMDGKDQSYYDLAIAVHPTLPDSVVVGGLSVWSSRNAGDTWRHATSYGEDGIYPYIHPDIHDLAYNPLNNVLYAANDGGLYKSADAGVTWTDLSPNIETSMIYHMAGWAGNLNKLMIGLQDNGVKYRSANSSAFHHINGGDGFDVVFNPLTGEPAYSTINFAFVAYSNNGENSEAQYIPLDTFWFQTLAIHNVHPDTIIVGSYLIFKSTDGGDSWDYFSGSGSWALTSCPSNSNRFYSAGGDDFTNGSGSLYFSGDIGETWVEKSENPGFPDPSNWIKITDVVVRPNNSSTVWACFGGFDAGYKVVTSTNTGDTWTNVSANLPNVPVNCLAIDNDNGVYAGTDIGIFYRSPSMSNWMPWSNGLPNVPVTGLIIYDDGTTKRVRAATFGRGVWQSNLASTCDASVVVTGGLEGIRHYEASTSISSTAFIQGGIGTFVSFKSGSYISLTDGFNVVDDSEFLGFIAPCGQGGIPAIQDETDFGDELLRADSSSSVIPLRRMWDPEDGLPYGLLKSVSPGQNTIRFNIKKPGIVQIYAARDVQDKLSPLFSGEMNVGTHTVEANLSALAPAFYYVLLFYEGKLAYFEEMEVR